MRIYPTLLVLLGGLLFVSCSNSRKLTGRYLTRALNEAKVPGEQAFMVLGNGDTLRGKKLKIVKNLITRKISWKMDGRIIPNQPVIAYQDGRGFWWQGELRLLKHPKMSIYLMGVNKGIIYSYSDRMYKHVSTLRMPYYVPPGNVRLHYKGGYYTGNPATLRSFFAGCPKAMEFLEAELAYTVWANPKRGNVTIGNLGKLSRIVNFFNEHCE